MLITVKESKESWKSPDGQIKIWDVKDQDGNSWQTMSGSIATALGQTLDLTTRVSSKGKTYLVKPSQDAPGGTTPPSASSSPSMDIEAFNDAVDRFARAVDKMTGTSAEPDVILEDLPPTSLYDGQMAVNEIEDDLT